MKKESASSRPAKRRLTKPKRTSRNFTRVVDPVEIEKNPRVRTRIDRELSALSKTRRKPDLSDARELPVPAWQNPIRGMDAWFATVRAGKLYKPMKQAVSMRLDADVVSWLKQSGPGYQTRANQILREKMLAER